MKNDDGIASTVELDRRLKQSIDHLRDLRETLEELGRSAGALQSLFGAEQLRGALQAAPPSRPAGKETAAKSPPARGGRPPASSAPSTQADQDEVPEWRKLFPHLSAEVPRKK